MCNLYADMLPPRGMLLRRKAGDGRMIHYAGCDKPGFFRCSWDEGGKRKERQFRVEDLECVPADEAERCGRRSTSSA